jgi:hypothetical protein
MNSQHMGKIIDGVRYTSDDFGNNWFAVGVGIAPPGYVPSGKGCGGLQLRVSHVDEETNTIHYVVAE